LGSCFVGVQEQQAGGQKGLCKLLLMMKGGFAGWVGRVGMLLNLPHIDLEQGYMKIQP